MTLLAMFLNLGAKVVADSTHFPPTEKNVLCDVSEATSYISREFLQ